MARTTFTAVYGITTEFQLRKALKDGLDILLTPPEGKDAGLIPCITKAANDVWIRLVFEGINYTYIYDNSSGWRYTSSYNTTGKQQSERREVLTPDQEALDLTLSPGVNYIINGQVSSLTITLGGHDYDQYHFSFYSTGVSPTRLELPNTVNMPANFSVDTDKRYEIDIAEGYATVQKWDTTQ